MALEWDVIALSLIGGICLGAFYFGGLWLTVSRLIASKQPVLKVLLSFYVRLVVLIAGFYLVMDDRWERFLIAMAGFLMVRIAAFRLARPNQTRVRAM
ncbi:MAG: ATP synthase subunit I [Desulfomonile tiedjei]|nr:ATP synthase subunit I [Desulfomonile tiedjei]